MDEVLLSGFTLTVIICGRCCCGIGPGADLAGCEIGSRPDCDGHAAAL
jgi:hypothetical protein